MIKFIDNLNYVEVIVDKTMLSEQYWPSYRSAIIMKDDVGRLSLDINDNQVTISFREGDTVDLSYQIIHPDHACSSNEELYTLLKGYLTS